jgi:hypothetical protein
MRITITPEAALAPFRTAAVAEVNSLIAFVRNRIITDIPGQQMIYLRKETEAKEWLASAEPLLSDFPLLAAEVGITAPSPDQLAQVWLNQAHRWAAVIAPALERLRMEALGAVAEATDRAGIDRQVAAMKEATKAMASLK